MRSRLGARQVLDHNHLKIQGNNFTSLVALNFPLEYDVM